MSGFFDESVADVRARRVKLIESLRERPEGFAWCIRHSDLLDSLWPVIVREAFVQFKNLPPFGIIATGGYGRREMSPSSDMDVAFVPLQEDSRLDDAMRWMFRTAHDVFGKELGLRVAYVYRLIPDLPGLDSVSLTNLLDARLLAGSATPLQDLREALWNSFPTADFLLAKLTERQRDREKTNISPLVTQPHIKLGAGGLRDFHTYNWIGQAIGERPLPMSEEVDFLLKIRNLLHLVAGRMHDELNYVRREELAGILQMTSFELGSQVARALDWNHEHYVRGLSRLRENRYDLGPRAQAIRGEVRIRPGTTAGAAAMAIRQATKIGLQLPDELPILKPEAGPDAVHALTAGVETIRNLERSGVMDILFPELSACRTLMPGDASHQFTVYEHTVQALQTYELIDVTSPLGQIKSEVPDSTVVRLAILFHDVGKADTSRPHSETGETITRQVCARWNLEPAIIDEVAWLVRHHLAMSQYIRLRDIDHPETAAEFAELVKTPQRLAALTLLTYADVSSVNGSSWSPIQESYLLNLYERTLYVLQSEVPESKLEEETVRRIIRSARGAKIAANEVEDFLHSMPTHYVLSTPEDTVLKHIPLFREAAEGEIIIDFEDHRDLMATEITIAMPDRNGILPDILGTLYAHNLSMKSLRCSTSEDAPATILDTFMVSWADTPLTREHKRRVEQSLRSVLSQESNRREVMLRLGKDPDRRQQFYQLNVIERDPAIIEVRAPRGRGLAFRLSQTISRAGLSIVSARLGQWAGTASAGFYVIDPGGGPVDDRRVRRAFENE